VSAAREEEGMDNSSTRSYLEECQREIRRLQEENQHLREASRAFSELAERLRALLEEANARVRPGGPTDGPA
jgi:predicted RNase H-like nuclease (RuvC/YqgF family)